MPRVLGPIQGAGVQVTERDAEQPITPAALGWAAYSGLLDRGPTDELIWCTSKSSALAQTGNLISDSLLPDAIRDYFDAARGAGGLLLVRVTDGTELPATRTLYTRRSTERSALGTLSAKNGGRWGGYSDRATGLVDDVADINATTIETGVTTWTEDQWVGAYLELAGVPNSRYEIVANDAEGIVTVSSDQDMDADLGASTNARWYIVHEGRDDRGLEYFIGDGEDSPDTEFSLVVHLDGKRVVSWENLSIDDSSENYWVNAINDLSSNHYVTATDLWTGARVASVRPSNIYGARSDLSATVLTAETGLLTVTTSPGGGNPTLAMGTVTSTHLPQVITITMSDATNGTAVSDLYGDLGAVVLGTEFVPSVQWAPPFTITAGVTALSASDVLTVDFMPLGEVDSLVGGTLYPDKDDNGSFGYRIVGNTNTTITVAVGSNMATDVSGGGDNFMVSALQKMERGRDGHAGVDDNSYIQAYDVDSSLFRELVSNNLGLVKFACPGVTSTAVQRAGAAFVSSLAANVQQWRYEIPANITTESAAVEHCHNVLGRSDFGDYVVSFPSFGYVVDPEAASRQKLVSLTGMIHGYEAQTAASWQGYHKAAAGVSAALTKVVNIPTGNRNLNEEYLNPRGLGVVLKKGGNFVVWGDRTLTTNTAWRFKHAREVMSYYINVLRENFDFSVFAINDPIQWALVRSSLLSFFIPQYAIRALDNTLPFEEALTIKIDTENNTPLTQSNGDLNVEIIVRIVNVVERLRFGIGKAGVIDTSA